MFAYSKEFDRYLSNFLDFLDFFWLMSPLPVPSILQKRHKRENKQQLIYISYPGDYIWNYMTNCHIWPFPQIPCTFNAVADCVTRRWMLSLSHQQQPRHKTGAKVRKILSHGRYARAGTLHRHKLPHVIIGGLENFNKWYLLKVCKRYIQGVTTSLKWEDKLSHRCPLSYFRL